MGDLSNIVRGSSPRPIKDPKWFDSKSDIGWLRIADVTKQDGKIYFLRQRLSKEGQSKTRVLKTKHLLLSIAATVGKPVINYVKIGVHDGFLIFLDPKFDLNFMFQWLELFRPYWNRYGQPGSQINLNTDIVQNQKIYIPKLEEQTQISNILELTDNLITVNQRELKMLRRLLNPGTCIISVKFFNLKRMLNMTYLINILSILVAIEFFYIMYLETFATQSKTTGRVFGMSSEKLADKNIQTLFKNQGIYNGLLGIGIIYSVFLLPSMLLPIMIYIIAVALYGSFSSGNKSIVFKQAGLAMVVTLLLLLH